MEKVILEAKSRDLKKSAKTLRKIKTIPAVIYGKHEKSLPLQVEYQPFRKAYMKAGTNQVVELNIDGKKKSNVLIHEVQFHPVSENIDHVDFLHISLTEAVTAHVPVETTGVSLAVKDLGGILTVVKHEITVKCLPTEIPRNVQVDITPLEQFGSAIHIKDLVFAKGIKVLDDEDDVVVTVTPPRKEEEVVVAAESSIAGTAAEAAAKEDAAKAAEAASKESGKKEDKK